MGKVAGIWVEIGAKLDGFNKGMTDAQRSMITVGKTMTSVGKSLTLGVTLPIIGIGVAAFKMSKDFNAAMANVATLIPGNIGRINELKTAVQDLAIRTGKSTKDIAGGLYQVISALGDTSDSMKILDIAARAGAAGLATTDDAINLVTAVMKGYGDTSAEAAQKAADLAFQTVKLGQTTFPELAASMGRVIPIAATLKMSQEELFAGFATLTGVTGGAAEVSTQFSAILRAMLKPTAEMSAAIGALGYASAAAMIENEGLVGGLRNLIGTTDGSQESISKLFGQAESLTAVFALAEGQSETFDAKLLSMKDTVGVLDEAFKEQAEGVNKTGFGWDQLKIKMEVVAQRLGDALAPAFSKLVDLLGKVADTIQKAVSWFGNLPKPVRDVGVAFLGILAAAGPVLIVVGKILTIIPTLAKGFAAVKLALLAITGPIGLVIAAVGLLAAGAVLVVKNWDKIKEFFAGIWEKVSSFFDTSIGKIIGILNPFIGIPVFIIRNWETVKVAMGVLWGYLKEGFRVAFKMIYDAVKLYIDITIAVFKFLYDNAKKIFEAIADAVVGPWNWIKEKVSSIVSSVADFVIDKLLWLMDKISKIPIIKKFVKDIEEGLAAAKEAVREASKEIPESADKAAEGVGAAYDKIGGKGDDLVTKTKTLVSIFEELGIKTRKDLTKELKDAETALSLLNKTGQGTPKVIKDLTDKIADLKEQLYGSTTAIETKIYAVSQYSLVLQHAARVNMGEVLPAARDMKGVLESATPVFHDIGRGYDEVANRAKGATEKMKTFAQEVSTVWADSMRKIAAAAASAFMKMTGLAKAFAAKSTEFNQGYFDKAKEDIEKEYEARKKAIEDDYKNKKQAIIDNVADADERAKLLDDLDKWYAGESKKTQEELDAWYKSETDRILADEEAAREAHAEREKKRQDSLWTAVKGIFGTAVEEMLTMWLTRFVSKVMDSILDIGGSIAKNIAGAASKGTEAIGVTVGAASSLASTIGVVGIAAAGLAGIISAFKKGPDFTYTNRLLEEQNWVYLTAVNQKLDALNEKTAAIVDKNDWMGNNLDVMRGTLWSIESIIKSIDDTAARALSALNGLVGAKEGATLTRPQLVMTHGTPSEPEYIVPHSKIQGFMTASPAGGGVSIPVTVNINGTMITDREYVNTRLIREITDALSSAPVQRNVQRALGIAGVGA
jgi:TP901 family phage tail tape measure protein